MHSTWYNSPSPAPLEKVTPYVPSIGTLVTGIIKSLDRMFLVADNVDPHFIEWCLLRVVFNKSMLPHPFLPVSRMVASLPNSSLLTRMTFASMESTSVFGYSITAKGTLSPRHLSPGHILSVHLSQLKTMQTRNSLCPSGNGRI